MRTPPLRALLAASLALGACRDLPTTPDAAHPAPAPAVQERVPLRCSVTMATRAMSCAAPQGPRGIRGNVILGGQGLNVRLTTTGVSYDESDHVLSGSVTVQNLLDQPMGTDGVTPSGVRVFFNSGPTVTSGDGSVAVLTDSVGTFLASGQPYYKYDGEIQPRGTSQPVLWQFAVDPGVNSFEFLVYVDAQLPAESSVLHWRPEAGTQVYLSDIYGVWAASAHDVFAVSDGAVLHYDGNYWRAMDVAGCGCGTSLYAVWGTSGRNVYAVGAQGTVVRWTGTTWDAEADPDLVGDDFYSVWGSSASDVWAVGAGGRMAHFDGADWAPVAPDSASGAPLYGVWGSAANDAWAVGESGTILHWDGTSWTSQSLADSTVTLNAVWGTSASDVWAAGSSEACGCGGLGGGVLYHFDGVEWTAAAGAPDLTELPIFSGWSSGGEVWMASVGTVLHYDGSDWTQDTVGYSVPLYGIAGAPAGGPVFTVGSLATIARNAGSGWVVQALPDGDLFGLWGSSPTDVWAVGSGIIRHRTGGEWTWDTAPDGQSLYAIWGSGPSDIWSVGDLGAVVHYDGSSWSTVRGDSAAATLRAVWGASASSVWAAGGDGTVLHWDGSTWSATTVGTVGWTGLWGSSASDVYMVGDAGEIQHWDGTAWSSMASATGDPLNGVWGSGPGDVYAVGENGTVIHYDGNAGGVWAPLATPAATGRPAYAVWGSGANDVFVLANAGRNLVHWDGASWRTATTFSENADVRMYAMWGTGPTNIYAAGDVGTILHGQR